MKHILLSFAFLTICAAGFGQTTGGIEGVVVDPTNAILPGATVRLQSADGRLIRATKADPSGRFHFPEARLGSYVVEVAQQGFRTITLEIAVTQQKFVTIALPIAAHNQQITVEGVQQHVSTESAGNRDSVEIDSNLLEQLPALDQDYISTLSMFLDPGATGTAGASLIVDGMEASRVGVSPSAIQQIKINNDPYAAEFFRPGRGRIEVVTKAAAPEYHGTFNFILRDASLSAANAFALTKPDEQRRTYEGFLTGPVARSRNTFFQLSVDRQELDTQAIVFAADLNGPIQQNVAAPRRDTDVSARITHLFNDRHTSTIDYSLEQSGSTNRGVGGVVLPIAGSRSFSQEHQWGYTDTLTMSAHLLNQFQVRYEKNRDNLNSMVPGRKIVVVDAFTSGGAQVDQWRTESALHFNEIVTWTGRRQTIKSGLNVPNVSFRSLVDHSNLDGAYYFSSLQSYAAGQPYSFTAQQGNGRILYDQFEMGGFFQDEIRLRANLAVTWGMRYDWQNGLGDKNNFSPRFSFAYAPGKKAKLVIRGGVGVFYDRTGPTPLADLARYDGSHLQSIVITDPAYPDPFVNITPGIVFPTNIVKLAPKVEIPYTVQYSLSVERQLTKESTLSLSYRGGNGFHLFRSRDVNAPTPPLYVSRPDPIFGTIREIESSGSQVSQALEISVKGRITSKISGMAQYTLSRTYNDTDGITFFPENSIHPSGEWGRASFDQLHRVNLVETIELARFINLGVGLRIYSGAPFTITTGLDQNHDGFANERPAGVSRNSAQGPGFADVDLRWFHDFKLTKNKHEVVPTIAVAVDAFNLLNTPNYPTFVGTISSPFFGRPISALAPRRLQLTARFKF